MYADTTAMTHFFNWTMTYRWDSDMISPYGYITPTGNVPLHPSDDQMKLYLSKPTVVNYAKGKTKMAAWFVSNCNSFSSRNEVVDILQKYIDVDVYGKCGTMTCPKKQDEDISSEECREMVANKYKFYFALENSLCRDYVTEK
jgi:alpha-1,3-fucosyltransferase